jgi:hypothetical protein
LIKQVPARATLYLPKYVKEFGRDVTFWHVESSEQFSSTLDEFVRLSGGPADWDDPSFEPVLRGFERRFRETGTEEGTVMATVLAYVIDEAYSSDRGAILAEFRASEHVMELFEQGAAEREAKRGALAAMTWDEDPTEETESETSR